MAAVDGGTRVEITADDVPDGISADDQRVAAASRPSTSRSCCAVKVPMRCSPATSASAPRSAPPAFGTVLAILLLPMILISFDTVLATLMAPDTPREAVERERSAAPPEVA